MGHGVVYSRVGQSCTTNFKKNQIFLSPLRPSVSLHAQLSAQETKQWRAMTVKKGANKSDLPGFTVSF